MSEYGPFATVIGIVGALTAGFSVVLLKTVGRVSKWTWLIEDTPPFVVTLGARVVACTLIAGVFILINKSNYVFFAGAAVLFALVTFGLIVWFDRLRRVHICKVPIVQADGSAATDRKGVAQHFAVVVGSERNMNAVAKAAYRKAREERGGVSLCGFMSGYGATKVNDPTAIWSPETLGAISNRMTLILMGILLCGVMAVYLAASSVEVSQRPVVETSTGR